MITINGKKYANNTKEFTNSLFDPSGTCSGYYKRKKDGVLLMDMQKAPIVFIKVGAGAFAVTAYNHEGKTRYMNGLTEKDTALLGLDTVRYSEQSDYLLESIKWCTE